MHKMHLDKDCQAFRDVYGAGHVYANQHEEGGEGGTVRQVPRDCLMASIFSTEGDVAGLLQLCSEMEMDGVYYIRLVAARFQGIVPDKKLMGAQKGCCGKKWQEIEEGATRIEFSCILRTHTRTHAHIHTRTNPCDRGQVSFDLFLSQWDRRQSSLRMIASSR